MKKQEKPTYEYLNKELKSAKNEIADYQAMLDETREENKTLKQQLADSRWRGMMVACFIKALLQLLKQLSSCFGIDLVKEVYAKRDSAEPK